DSYFNLNGWWQYAITNSAYPPTQFDGQILVPFSPESALSGVGKQLRPNQYLHYRTTFTLPKSFNKGIVLLHFGAVDNVCSVFVNGLKVGSHNGGYTAFSFDVTLFLQEKDNVLDVIVTDSTERGAFATGKQRLKGGKIWYTAQSGIWQTVWMESVPTQHIKGARIVPNVDDATVTVHLDKHQVDSVTAIVYDNDVEIAKIDTTSDVITLPMPQDFLPWTPENPKLYDLVLISRRDKVKCYFAMRKFSIKRDYFGRYRTMLNNKPYFVNGVLDQGYWSDGLYTPPCDQAIQFDVATAKSFGFNALRKHVKVEPMRWYYHCDKIGILVWQDMPNGGKTKCFTSKIWPCLGATKINDKRYHRFARADAKQRKHFTAEYQQMLSQLANVPCIFAFNVFNEGWGQFDSNQHMQLTKQLDSARLVCGASGWHDQGGGDFCSQHVYFKRLKIKRSTKRAVVLGEFGGFGLKPSGTKGFCYKAFRDSDKYAAGVANLYARQVHPLVKRGLTACFYTQLTDVEREINGLVSYDRRQIKLDADRLKQIVTKVKM
ncbi:MAG: beta galactosidase jelly roll domain-containing protein, partial [Clostridia bacterium]|nr:beta galactosidase jelly roll domain-containing protein [Clostridia bacterium]